MDDLAEELAPEQALLEGTREVVQLVQQVVSTDGKDANGIYDLYHKLLVQYQEQPQLLDGVLESIVQPLALLLRARALEGAADLLTIAPVCRLLQVVISVRGYKTVVRFFPHETADLERVLQVLEQVQTQAAAAAGVARGTWEAQSVLLLWLSMLILTPFDLATVDSAVGSAGEGGVGLTPLALRVLALCQGYLDHPGTPRDMAALLLARLATRPDMGAALDSFLAWQRAALADASGPSAPFLVAGVLQCLALVFKLGQREGLARVAPGVWRQLGALLSAGGVGGGGALLQGASLSRKAAVKLAQRVGLSFLPRRLAPWRYTRAHASLNDTLGAGNGAAPAAGACSGQGLLRPPCEAAGGADEEEGEIELAEEVEEVLGTLLQALGDRDTVVRWSAAKGVGRLTGCLPCELGDEVVSSVLALLSETEGDAAWHGGCLALAELARRGLLLPSRLPGLAPALGAALAYDVRRGPCSVGAHVRDAASYVCWALARAYAPPVLAEAAAALAPPLVAAAALDREVHVRRAAASALQELVGRSGRVPHGLDVLRIAEPFRVGSLQQAYLSVAPELACFDAYRPILAATLLSVKLRHWDRALRALAARSLAALAPSDPAWAAGPALRQLLAWTGDPVLDVRCGAVVGVAELLPALAALGVALPRTAPLSADADAGEPDARERAPGAVGWAEEAALGDAVAGLLGALEQRRLYRGKGGELMREAACRLLEQLCAAQLVAAGGAAAAVTGAGAGSPRGGEAPPRGAPPPPPHGAALLPPAQGTQRAWLRLEVGEHTVAQALLQDCLRHSLESIRCAAAAALTTYARASCTDSRAAGGLAALMDACMAALAGEQSAAQRGAALALGVLPATLAAPRAEALLQALCAAATAKCAADEAQAPAAPGVHPDACARDAADVESRVHAVRALGRLARELYSQPIGQQEEQQRGLSQPAQRQVEQQHQAQPGGTSREAGAAPPRVALLSRDVLPALLTALEDYTTDNRGDVGSWVREAATEEAAATLQLLWQLQAAARAPQHPVAAPGAATGWAPPPPAAVAPADEAAMAEAVTAALLRQSVERISRVRQVAQRQLARLLADPRASFAVQEADALRAALPADGDDGAAAACGPAAQLQAVERMSELLVLPVPRYRAALLEGLVATVGGVDASLSQAASGALLRCFRTHGAPLQAAVARQLLELWARAARSPRLATPFIRTALLLISGGDLGAVPAVPLVPAATAAASSARSSPVAEDSSGAIEGGGGAAPAGASFAQAVLVRLKGELSRCRDVTRLMEAATLAARLSGEAGCWEGAIATVLALLGSRIPRVRRHAAEQLYLQLLTTEESEEAGDAAGAAAAADARAACSTTGLGAAALSAATLEEAMDVLMATAWDGEIDAAQAARSTLASLLGVQLRARTAGRPASAGAAAGTAAGSAKLVGREQGEASYQSLLDDAARGGGY